VKINGPSNSRPRNHALHFCHFREKSVFYKQMTNRGYSLLGYDTMLNDWRKMEAVRFCYTSVTNYSKITSTKSPSSCMTTFSVSLTNLTVLLPQSRDSSYYVSRRILAPAPLRLQKHADISALSRLVTSAWAR
jgi:hypothetical protein